jgi:DNA repair exonuclease SbcCD nuclease subunit
MNYPEIEGVELMGDVHLGRRFIEGVPLDRRGEREEMVWAQFEHDLHTHNGDYHIQVGDLFDTFDVDNAVVKRAAALYKKAAKNLRTCKFLILRGNHDASRSDTRVSSFELFKEMVEVADNIEVIDTPRFIPLYGDRCFGMMPWSPFQSAEELAKVLCLNRISKVEFVVCHCDLKGFGNDFNVIPVDTLKQITDVIVTGHDHHRQDLKMGGATVHVTGSMQPYNHGEDPLHTLYWTGTTAELAQLPDTSKLYIRVVLQPGEAPPEIPNCLGYKTVTSTATDDEEMEVGFDEFVDTIALFKEILKEFEVSAYKTAAVLSKFTESLNDQNS